MRIHEWDSLARSSLPEPIRQVGMRLLCGALLCTLMSLSAAARADGALAVSRSGTPGAPRAGLAVNEQPGPAEDAAMKQCGKDCSVVFRFRTGCAAFAAGRSAMGWNAAATLEEATFGALQQCRGYGPDCALRNSACESNEQAPGALVAQQNLQRTLKTRRPDAVLSIPPRSVHKVYASVAFVFPAGSRFIRLRPQEAESMAPYEMPSGDVEWMRATPDCYPVGGNKPRWQAGAYPCNAQAIAVPKALLVETGQSVDYPAEAMPIFNISSAFTTKRLDALRGLVDPGTRLFRAPDVRRSPADEGYLWKKGEDYAWFNIDPAACEIAGKVFDCSQPVPIGANSWKPLSTNAAVATSPTAISPGSENWSVSGVRTGMSPNEVRTTLERSGYKVSIFQTHYHYPHPVTGAKLQDDSTSMTSMVTGIAMTPNGQVAQPEDTVVVLLTPVPGAEKVYAAMKSVSYARVAERSVSLEALRKTAFERFGTPQIDASTGSNYAMYWPPNASRAQLKPWGREPDLGTVVIGCGENAMTGTGANVTFLHQSPLTLGVGMPPTAMREHCGERFVVGRASLSPVGSSVSTIANGMQGSESQISLRSDVPVLAYHFWLYDGAIAQAGQSALIAAETELALRAAKKQSDSSASNKPRL